MSKHFRINERIRVPTIRLIDENEAQIGLIATDKALAMAKERELDLVEVAPNAKPPVCKILDFGKFQYRLKKQDQKQKKAQKQTEVKGIRLSMRTDTHDLEVKANKAKEFLKERHLIKVTLMMRGRELAHPELAFEQMSLFAKMLNGIGVVQERPKRQGKSVLMMINPV